MGRGGPPLSVGPRLVPEPPGVLPTDDIAAQLLCVAAELELSRSRVAELEDELRERKIECGAKHSLFKFPPEVQIIYTKLPKAAWHKLLMAMESVERALPVGGGGVSLDVRRHATDGDWRDGEAEPYLSTERFARAPGNRLTMRKVQP